MSTHYSNALETKELFEAAKFLAIDLHSYLETCAEDGYKFYPIFVFTGLSGIATATALTYDFSDHPEHRNNYGMMYIRKENEKSHGHKIEHNGIEPRNIKDIPLLVFVDDMIDTGKTARRCLMSAKKFLNKHVLPNSIHKTKFHKINFVLALIESGVEELITDPDSDRTAMRSVLNT